MSLAYRVSKYNRDRKWRTFRKEIAPNAKTRILDVGYSDEECIGTENYLEKHYTFKNRLIALGVDSPLKFKSRYPATAVVRYNGGTFPFKDKTFDVTWSNAVIEHVGDRKAQLHFLKEIKRVSHRAFITTPNKKFPIEVHTRTPLLHYLPNRLFSRYLQLVGKNWATGDFMNLLSLRDIESLLADAGIPAYKIVKNRLAGFILDFIILI